MEEMVRLSYEELKELMYKKFVKAGLPTDQAEELSNHLAYADSRGVHSHGAVRVEYYSERIAKGGSNKNPHMSFKQTGPCTGIYDGDNAIGHYVALKALEVGMDLAKENGLALIGIKRLGHCGTLSYFIRKAVDQGFVAMSMCQSDPMVAIYGAAEPYFGTNPIGFGAKGKTNGPVIFDMATTVGAWGKVLDARAKHNKIPKEWAIDKEGKHTDDPNRVAALLPIAGAKGSGLMMMVDILCGALLGQPFGGHVSSMYADLSAGRELGQIHLLINPDFFVGSEAFQHTIDQMLNEIVDLKPAEGFQKVQYPGQRSDAVVLKYQTEGIPIVKDIYDYLVSDDVHFNRYEKLNAFAE